MFKDGNNIDITRNIRLIEWLKSELLTTMASLFEILLKVEKASQETLVDILANIILVTYVLGKRLGINFSRVDMKIEDKLRLGILEKHKIEEWNGDLSALKQHLSRKGS
ncbi:MAG: MazG-like family protein [Anaeromicrobium sp.]|uniref:MazG-like family protein n=1 Tax=Anaeromicrobium sp. TaxID=1929132 RepID=UPI0025D32AE6|nr:MazG-like family protein [Anaeromicrobium sp.]MCT4595433.1 MazG-like family protein [Anaeromicrobium sp.]